MKALAILALLLPAAASAAIADAAAMQALGTTGTLTIALAPEGSGTKVDVTYAIGGYLAAGLNTFAAPVNGVLTQQFDRLKLYVETGNATSK